MNTPITTPIKIPDSKELRKFGWLFAALLIVLFAVLLPLLKNRPQPLWPIYGGVPIAIMAAIWPAALAPLYRVWMIFGAIAGFINTRIIMSVVFFIFLTPIAYAMRWLGKDPLARRFDRSAASYRVIKAVPDKQQMEKPY